MDGQIDGHRGRAAERRAVVSRASHVAAVGYHVLLAGGRSAGDVWSPALSRAWRPWERSQTDTTDS